MLRAVSDRGVMICSLPPSLPLTRRSTLPVHPASPFLFPLLPYLFTYLPPPHFPPSPRCSPPPTGVPLCHFFPFYLSAASYLLPVSYIAFCFIPPRAHAPCTRSTKAADADVPPPQRRLIEPTSSSTAPRLYANPLVKSSTLSHPSPRRPLPGAHRA